jgi:hypothetical protein
MAAVHHVPEGSAMMYLAPARRNNRLATAYKVIKETLFEPFCVAAVMDSVKDILWTWTLASLFRLQTGSR